jgi:hypothetical protein
MGGKKVVILLFLGIKEVLRGIRVMGQTLWAWMFTFDDEGMLWDFGMSNYYLQSQSSSPSAFGSLCASLGIFMD